MTQKEESWIKTAKKQLVSTLVILSVGGVVALSSFYWTSKADIKELKEVVRKSSPEEVSKMKADVMDMRKEMEDLKIQVVSSVKVMESFKADQEKKVDKILDLLIELKSNR